MMEGPWRQFRRKHEPVSDFDTVVVDSLKALDPNRPIREADLEHRRQEAEQVPHGSCRLSQSPQACALHHALKDMLELASHIVETKAGHFDPDKFEDHYEDALKDLLKKKQSGEKIEAPKNERRRRLLT